MRHYYLTTFLVLPFLTGFKAPETPAAKPALPPVVDVGAAAAPGLMDALLQQKSKPEDLWSSGRLNGDSLVAVLNEQPWGRAENQPLASQLCALLVEKAPEKLKDPLALPPRTRLRLAQYFKSIKDARAVTFYEAILSLIKAPREAGVVEVFELSDYYSAIGDWQKATETRLRMKDYTTAEPFIANANVEAARMYVEHGQPEKAQPLYERAEKSSYGWAVGVALLDHGRALMERNKYDEAIKVLLTPVTGRYADQIEVALLSDLGLAYYKTGNFKEASKSAQQSMLNSKQIDLLQGEGLGAELNVAYSVKNWSEQWLTSPVQVEPQNLRVVMTSQSPDKYSTQMVVRTYRSIPIIATTEDVRLKVHVSDEESNEFFAQKTMQIELLPDAVKNSFDSTITIQCPTLPAFNMQVPIHVEVQKPISLSSSTVFLGFVNKDATVQQSLTLSSIRPFRVIGVQTDVTSVKVKFDVHELAMQHLLQITFSPIITQNFYSGTIRIQTNIPEQEVIEVPYIASANRMAHN